MKKRVVAIMLSLTMCLSMAAEASAASEADFTAETAAADVSEVAVFDDTADEGSSDDAVVVEPDDTGADDVQIDMGSDEDTSTDDAKETNEQESEVDASVQRMKQLTCRYMVWMKLQVQKIHLIRLLLNGWMVRKQP